MKDGSFHFGYKMISLSVHLFNTIMIILLPTAFPFTQTAPFTNLQLDTTTTPPDLSSLQTRHHHTSHLDSSSLYTCKAVYHFSTDHRNHNVHLRTQPRRHHHPAPSHNPHPDGAHHRQLPRAAHRSRAGDLPALRAQAERERASGAGSLHGVRGLRRQRGSQDAACRLPPAATPRWLRSSKRNWVAFRAAAEGVTQAWASPDSIVDMHRREAKRVNGLKEEWKDEYERVGLVDQIASFNPYFW